MKPNKRAHNNDKKFAKNNKKNIAKALEHYNLKNKNEKHTQHKTATTQHDHMNKKKRTRARTTNHTKIHRKTQQTKT
jgi:hypothetical protein